MREQRFAKGEVIFWEGEASDAAYTIRSGSVEIEKNTETGPVRLALLSEGEIFGEMGIVEERPRSATARAAEPVVATAVRRDEFIGLLLHRPQDGLDILRALFERLRAMNQLLADHHRAEVPPDHSEKRVRLLPSTPQTQETVPANGLEVTRFPFRIGRKPQNDEMGVLAFNEVELSDPAGNSISLNHFAIDRTDEGIIVRDRGSRQGTIVNDVPIGGQATTDSRSLKPGDNQIIVGTPDSQYRFNIVLS